MNSQRLERREIRYPLHLPVLLRTPLADVQTRSENISLSGILLSSARSIPEGLWVEVAVGVGHMPDTGILLKARGRIVRVRSLDKGDFMIAIQLERSFELPMASPPPQSRAQSAPAVFA